MKLRLQKRCKFFKLKEEEPEEYYYEYIEIEIETFRWNKNHTFEYVSRNSNLWKKLKDNEEIIGLSI